MSYLPAHIGTPRCMGITTPVQLFAVPSWGPTRIRVGLSWNDKCLVYQDFTNASEADTYFNVLKDALERGVLEVVKSMTPAGKEEYLWEHPPTRK